MVVGITGHQRLSGRSDWAQVRALIIKALEGLPTPLVGLSSLAIGADQVFAEAVLELGGDLRAVIPFEGYQRTFDEDGLRNYERLLERASASEIVSSGTDDQTAYLAAGARIIETCDLLIAVWDGEPAKGKGGTGDAVAYARSQGKAVTRIDPYTRTTKELTD